VIFIRRQKPNCPQAFHVNEPCDSIYLFCSRGVSVCCLSPSSLCSQIHEESWQLSFPLIGVIVFLFLGGDQRGLDDVHTDTHITIHQTTHIFCCCEIDSGHIADVWDLSQSPRESLPLIMDSRK